MIKPYLRGTQYKAFSARVRVLMKRKIRSKYGEMFNEILLNMSPKELETFFNKVMKDV